MWSLSELVDFLNSYNRLLDVDTDLVEDYKYMYLFAREELIKRSELLGMLY